MLRVRRRAARSFRLGGEALLGSQSSDVALDVEHEIERAINGFEAEERLGVRHEQSGPLLTALEAWLRDERSRLSRSASVVNPIDDLLRRWDRFTGFLNDGRICLTNNAAERALGGFALGRQSWLFADSERGAARAAAMSTLITSIPTVAIQEAGYVGCRR
ncbi:hypothetical protein BQ8482_500019 [Mesorhizobium delmotii]|uniref:Transposase IS66 central domain-containing protein n=1 Tax=Mesorhizobium delmotii TaxID=1631247 RepID=A0A2P9AUF3_9HYPH|nr:hypothetical protein BQ8482_500019 [Mesorhizobium delmotii]